MAGRRLSNRQRARIAQLRAKRKQRALQASEANQPNNPDNAQPGRVIVRHGQNLLVRDRQGTDHHCLLRQNLTEAVCGDHVLWQPTEGDQGVIIDVLERKTLLARPDYGGRNKPLAANISQLIVVLAPRPAPTGYLTDQYLVAAELLGIKALLLLNKADLLSDEQRQLFSAEFSHYPAIGYPVIEASTRRSDGLNDLLRYLPGQTSILVGQSGVGKSSLINALIPEQHEAVGALSDASGLGRHTTSIAKLHFLDNGAEIIDSPGVRSFRLGSISIEDLQRGFPEIAALSGQCRFSNCSHTSEPGCALRQGIEQGRIHPQRLSNYLHMASKLKQNRSF